VCRVERRRTEGHLGIPRSHPSYRQPRTRSFEAGPTLTFVRHSASSVAPVPSAGAATIRLLDIPQQPSEAHLIGRGALHGRKPLMREAISFHLPSRRIDSPRPSEPHTASRAIAISAQNSPSPSELFPAGLNVGRVSAHVAAKTRSPLATCLYRCGSKARLLSAGSNARVSEFVVGVPYQVDEMRRVWTIPTGVT
jgi:hypothetical protein